MKTESLAPYGRGPTCFIVRVAGGKFGCRTAAPCAKDDLGSEKPSSKCAEFLGSSPKSKQHRELERRFRVFEAEFEGLFQFGSFFVLFSSLFPFPRICFA
jgi:hypothetical protein